MTRLSLLRRLLRDTAASAAAETVLIMPLAVLMLVLTMEAGHFLYVEHQVIKSVRDAARYASRQSLSTFNCTAVTAAAALPNDGSALGTIRTNTANIARYGNLATNQVPKLISTWDDNEVSVTYSCVDVNAGIYSGTFRYAPRVTVTGTPNYPSLFGRLAGFNTDKVLYARSVAMVYGI